MRPVLDTGTGTDTDTGTSSASIACGEAADWGPTSDGRTEERFNVLLSVESFGKSPVDEMGNVEDRGSIHPSIHLERRQVL